MDASIACMRTREVLDRAAAELEELKSDLAPCARDWLIQQDVPGFVAATTLSGAEKALRVELGKDALGELAWPASFGAALNYV